MPKPILRPYVRTLAASCLGLTPHTSIDEVRATVCAQLSVPTPEAVFDIDTVDVDPILFRKIAAAQLLLTAADDPRHSTRLIAFSAADSRVPEARKVFQAKAEPIPGEQLVLVP